MLVPVDLRIGLADAASVAQDVARTDTEESFRFLGAPELWVVGLVVLPAVVAFAWWSYGGLARLEPRTRATLSVLRGLAIALCLIALFQPAFERILYSTVRTQVHVLVDDSASMQRRDTYPDDAQRNALQAAVGGGDLAAQMRFELVRSVLGKPNGLLEQLAKNHDVRLYRFSRNPLLIRDLDELSARGPRTQIGDALDLHLGSTGTNNLDAVLLVSDGRSNAGVDPIEAARKYRLADLPIFTIGVGDPNPPRNVRIVGPPGPRDALRKEEVVFDVTVSSEGLEGRPVTVTMSGARDGGAYLPLTSSSATLVADGAPARVRLYHAFDDAGDWTLKFEVSSFPEETTREDNVDVRFLRVDDQKIRVLYLEEAARWEYRYMRSALIRVDPSIEAQVLLFDASRDFVQEHSESLPPLKSLPRTRDELFRYHVVLIGDVPPERIGATEEQRTEWLDLLVEFVEFGGGVGVQFGEQWMPNAYRGTPLEHLLPVVLEDPAELVSLRLDRTSGFVPRLENPTRPHDIVSLLRDPEANARLWREGIDRMYVYYPVQQARAGADVLLRHPTDENRYGKRVLAATGLYPKGRTMFLATDEMWRLRNPYGERYYDSFWRNVVRDLAQGRLRRKDDRVDLRLDKVVVETGEQVRVTISVRDERFQPSVAPEQAIFLRKADGEPERRTLQPLLGDIGTFQGAFTMDEPGSFSVMAFEGDNPAGKVIAREDVLVKIPDREMAQSSQDQRTLQEIANESKGGRYLFLADADRLAAEFESRKPFQKEVDRSTRTAWDTMWTLGGILLLLGIEWIVRKRARLV